MRKGCQGFPGGEIALHWEEPNLTVFHLKGVCMSSGGFIEYVLDSLAPLGRFRSRKMFGGYGIYRGDIFFALVADDILYFNVDASNQADYEELGSKPFTYMGKEKPVSLSYWEVPADVMESPEQLGLWVDKACAAASTVKKTRKPTKKKVAAKKREK